MSLAGYLRGPSHYADFLLVFDHPALAQQIVHKLLIRYSLRTRRGVMLRVGNQGFKAGIAIDSCVHEHSRRLMLREILFNLVSEVDLVGQLILRLILLRTQHRHPNLV